MYKLRRTKRAKKDAEMCERAGFKAELDEICATLEQTPYKQSQGFERLTGNLKGFCSRQINFHNRVLYEILPNTKNEKNNDGSLYEGIIIIYESWGHRYKPPK